MKLKLFSSLQVVGLASFVIFQVAWSAMILYLFVSLID